jgi:hypothetical protein
LPRLIRRATATFPFGFFADAVRDLQLERNSPRSIRSAHDEATFLVGLSLVKRVA